MKKLIFILILLPAVSFSENFSDPNTFKNKDTVNAGNTTNAYELKARKALETIVKEQIDQIKDVSNSTNSDDEKNIKDYVLSTHVRSFKDIPENIDHEIDMIREQVRLLIRQVATDVEITGGSTGTLTLADTGEIYYKPNPNIPKELNDKRKNLLQANLKNSVSVRSAAMAIHLLAGINDGLKVQAKNAKTRQQKEKVYMRQAIYVYEMADIVIELLNSLSLDGIETIEKLHKETIKKVNTRINDISQQVRKAEALNNKGLLTDTQLQKEKLTYSLMEKANEQSLVAWEELLASVGKQEDFIDNLKSKSILIEYKRDKAKVQLETLRDLRQIAELRDSIGELDDLVESVANLDLLVLDETTVRSLLGYEADQ